MEHRAQMTIIMNKPPIMINLMTQTMQTGVPLSVFVPVAAFRSLLLFFISKAIIHLSPLK
jgi:hypothetical protein